MKKIFFLVLCMIYIMNIHIVYGEEGKKMEAVSQPLEDGELEKKIGTEEYEVVLNGENTGNCIKLHEFSPKVGVFVSLRETVEALGGYINWEPNWNPDKGIQRLGDFEILGTKFEYESGFLLDPENENKKYKETFCPIALYTNIDGHKTELTMSGTAESMIARFVNNTIYIDIRALRRLLPRIGYLINFDQTNKTINIKDYDLSKEKKLLLEKFPTDKFGSGYYGRDYENTTLVYTNEWYCLDMFLDQVADTEAIEKSYYNYINPNFRSMFVVDEDNMNFYKNLFEASYCTYFDNIKVDYDADLDAYIIYNKEFSNVSELDNSYKIIVIRKFDNMLMFIK